jgi:hypothetical protein
MERQLVSEQIDALRVEALEARRLAETLCDPQSILDLQNYAAGLEAEAASLGLRNSQQRAETPKRREFAGALCNGHAGTR